MSKRLPDPLNLIPSASTVRAKLAEVEGHAEALRYLLKTAEEVEQRRRLSLSRPGRGA